MKKILSSLIISTVLFSCSQVTSVVQPNKIESVKQVEKISSNVSEKKVIDLVKTETTDNLFIAEVSKTLGASFKTSINLNNFSTKANVNGTVAKQPADVSTIDVYLLNLPSGFTGTDPLGTANANVVKSFTNIAKTGANFNILFKNVGGLATNQYWVGVVAKDSGGNVISKTNPTWTGQTLTSFPALALSTSGIGVNTTTLAVSSTSDLVVNIPLLDSIGAQINTNANVTGGTTTLPTITAQ